MMLKDSKIYIIQKNLKNVKILIWLEIPTKTTSKCNTLCGQINGILGYTYLILLCVQGIFICNNTALWLEK